MRAFLTMCGSVAILIAAGGQLARAQGCPANSHPVIVFLPTSPRTAHCWCDDGFRNIGGVCTRISPTVPDSSSNGGGYWRQYSPDQLKDYPVR
jgi:hypothetical protein